MDSEVLLGLAGSMPNPGVTESLCSGSISPNRRPVWRGGAGCAADLDDFAVGDPAVRGLEILLANDCELPESGSSMVGLDRCPLRVPELFRVSRPVSRVIDVLGEPCEAAAPPTLGDFPLTLVCAVSRVELLVVLLRGLEVGWGAD